MFSRFFLQLGGLTLLALGIWVSVDGGSFLRVVGPFSNEGIQFVKVGIFCIAIGAALVLLGFLGCCGAHKDSKCMLLTVSVPEVYEQRPVEVASVSGVLQLHSHVGCVGVCAHQGCSGFPGSFGRMCLHTFFTVYSCTVWNMLGLMFTSKATSQQKTVSCLPGSISSEFSAAKIRHE